MHTLLASAPPTDVGARRVLVVDDDALVRRVFGAMLERVGHDVTAVHDGAKAIALLQGGAAPFDVMVTDLAMPGLRGELLTHLAQEAYPAMAIVVVSGWIGRDVRRRLKAQPAVVTLPKPVLSDAQLFEAVERAITAVATIEAA